MTSPHETVLAAMMADAKECNRRAGFRHSWVRPTEPKRVPKECKEINCAICGEPFEQRRVNQKYCGSNCYDEGRRRLSKKRWQAIGRNEWFEKKKPFPKRLCTWCGMEFQPDHQTRTLCREQCRKEKERQRDRDYRARKKGIKK